MRARAGGRLLLGWRHRGALPDCSAGIVVPCFLFYGLNFLFEEGYVAGLVCFVDLFFVWDVFDAIIGLLSCFACSVG